MDYSRFDKIVRSAGLEDNPAITDKNFLVKIAPLPPEYSDRALGLYYPEAPDNPSKSRLWVPEEASDETVKHELAHRIGHFYRDDISEPYAESYRRTKMTAPVLLQRSPSMQGYTSINSLTINPPAPSPGDIVTVALTITNNYSARISILGDLLLQIGSAQQAITYDSPIDGSVDPGYTLLIIGHFTMPAGGVSLIAHSLWYGSDNQWHLEQTQSLPISSGPPGITGWIVGAHLEQGGKTVDKVMPGAKFELVVAYYAYNPAGGQWSVGIHLSSPDSNIAGDIVDSTSIFGGNSLGSRDGSITKTFSALVMPEQGSIILDIDFFSNEHYSQSNPPPGVDWILADATTLLIPSYYPTPEEMGYTQENDLIFPDGEIYSGECETGVYKYSLSDASAQIFGGLMANKLADAFQDAATQQGASMLELTFWKRPTYSLDKEGNPIYYQGQPVILPNSHDYLAVATMAFIPATRLATQAAPINWNAIFSIIKLLLIIGGVITAAYFIKNIAWGPKNTTYIPPQTIQLAPNTPYVATIDGTEVTAGSGGATILDPQNNVVAQVPPNGKAIVPKGDKVISGSGGGTVNIPGYTKETYPQATSLSDILKYVVIAAGVLGVGLVAIAGFQAMGKRSVYPARA